MDTHSPNLLAFLAPASSPATRPSLLGTAAVPGFADHVDLVWNQGLLATSVQAPGKPVATLPGATTPGLEPFAAAAPVASPPATNGAALPAAPPVGTSGPQAAPPAALPLDGTPRPAPSAQPSQRAVHATSTLPAAPLHTVHGQNPVPEAAAPSPLKRERVPGPPEQATPKPAQVTTPVTTPPMPTPEGPSPANRNPDAGASGVAPAAKPVARKPSMPSSGAPPSHAAQSGPDAAEAPRQPAAIVPASLQRRSNRARATQA